MYQTPLRLPQETMPTTVELLSPSTEQEDLGKPLREVNRPSTKWEAYERILRVP